SRMFRMPCHRVELHHLPTGQVIVWEHSDGALARQLERIESIGVEAAGTHAALDAAGGDPEALETLFPPRSGPLCQWCDYLDHCEAGKDATPQRLRPWAGLAPDITSTVDDVQ
ncbi:MAG TPA: hypothetical protein VHE57_08295, partial [Mycobacteriales bacterium]|nr:hypothetical protein [Mycobacteriales bacterium]